MIMIQADLISLKVPLLFMEVINHYKLKDSYYFKFKIIRYPKVF